MTLKAPPLPVPHRDLDLRLAALAHAQAQLRASWTGRLQGMVSGDGGWSKLPEGVRREVEARIVAALEKGFAADPHPTRGRTGGAVMVSGALGGAFGIPGALAEMPVSLVLFLQAIREEARAAGLDPAREGVRRAAIDILLRGQVVGAEEALEASFLNARLGLSGPMVTGWVARLVPKLAPVLGQRLAAGAVPVVGALGGALANRAWESHYRGLAQVRFGLMALAEVHGVGAVVEGWKRAERLPAV
ncbi:EcsC family protein [Stagnihabitans tardus]|uniref:EcsC family protein n=1 Tax=Stagnihabitans tardus TaxID=2699202 RepID=A0AAE4YEG1_9RHOB|nr:EcsC family protein [Stagnihabitans tardus]NBZ89861.1 EcsC family protein [Stagnihabitans tardus]